jgi:hypothetical protein
MNILPTPGARDTGYFEDFFKTVLNFVKRGGYTVRSPAAYPLRVMSEATHDLLHAEEDEEQHRDDEDDVRDHPVAVLGSHAAGVQEPE